MMTLCNRRDAKKRISVATGDVKGRIALPAIKYGPALVSLIAQTKRLSQNATCTTKEKQPAPSTAKKVNVLPV
jgi:hypothetical protein